MTSDSRTIRLADANLANHAGYAVIYHLWQAQKEGAGGASAITENAVMENSCKIGLVHAGSLPVRITHMERHNTTKEVMIAGEKEMVVLLAPPSSADHPSVDDIGLFVLCPGDVLVINEGEVAIIKRYESVIIPAAGNVNGIRCHTAFGKQSGFTGGV